VRDGKYKQKFSPLIYTDDTDKPNQKVFALVFIRDHSRKSAVNFLIFCSISVISANQW